MPQTDKEAVAYEKAAEGKAYEVPVYESDERTRMGTYTMGPYYSG